MLKRLLYLLQCIGVMILIAISAPILALIAFIILPVTIPVWIVSGKHPYMKMMDWGEKICFLLPD